MRDYTTTNISGAESIKQILDRGFIERFHQIALHFLSNYTGEGCCRYDWPGPKTRASVLKGEVFLDAEVRFLENSVVGKLYLSDSGFKALKDGSDQSYHITISPDFNVECSIGGNMFNVLPSRMATNYRKVFTALEHAVKGSRVEPTRYIPTNKDTLTEFTVNDLMKPPMIKKVMKINKTLREWGYKIDDSLERLDLNDELGEFSFLVNPLNGLIGGYNAEMLGDINLHNWAGYAALNRLETELLKIERIASETINEKENEIVVQQPK
jgi:hypothetical protein